MTVTAFVTGAGLFTWAVELQKELIDPIIGSSFAANLVDQFNLTQAEPVRSLSEMSCVQIGIACERVMARIAEDRDKQSERFARATGCLIVAALCWLMGSLLLLRTIFPRRIADARTEAYPLATIEASPSFP